MLDVLAPVDQLNVIGGVAPMRVAPIEPSDPPCVIGSIPVRVMANAQLVTRTMTLSVAVQPLASVTVSVYSVWIAGDADGLAILNADGAPVSAPARGGSSGPRRKDCGAPVYGQGARPRPSSP